MKINDQTAFITGANRGLGFEAARELGEQGIHVVLGTRDLASGEAAALQLREKGISAVALRFDVLKPEAHQAAYTYFEQNHDRLDILVNNAGFLYKPESAFNAPTPVNHTSTASPEILKQTFDINFFAQVALTQTLLPLIRKSPAGRIVNLSSILGSLTLQADPTSPIYHLKTLAYDASKAALNVFTIHLAHELRDTNIKVNSAHPGWVKTELGGPNAPMEVSEGGKTSAQLATLPADGPTGGFFHLGQSLPW